MDFGGEELSEDVVGQFQRQLNVLQQFIIQGKEHARKEGQAEMELLYEGITQDLQLQCMGTGFNTSMIQRAQGLEGMQRLKHAMAGDADPKLYPNADSSKAKRLKKVKGKSGKALI